MTRISNNVAAFMAGLQELTQLTDVKLDCGFQITDLDDPDNVLECTWSWDPEVRAYTPDNLTETEHVEAI